jgi:hypothetical protein
MKLMIRTCGFAAVAAIATMVFPSAPTARASSTLLCSADTPASSPSSAECSQPTLIHLNTTEKITLLNSILNVQCNALVLGDLLPGLSTNGPSTIHLTQFNYSNCGAPCTVEALKTGEGYGLLLILKEGEELASLTGHNIQIFISCFAFIQCEYNWSGLVGHILGPLATGSQSHVTYSKDALNVAAGKLCPSIAELDALFTLQARLTTGVYLRS